MHRDAHLEDFQRLAGLLSRGSRAVVVAIRHASAALLDADAGQISAAGAQRSVITALHREIDTLVPVLLARQQPVASDLRLVVAAVRMNADIERMGALAGHIARVAGDRHPRCAVPAPARRLVAALAEVATVLAERSSVVLATRDPVAALQLGLDDDVTDDLQRQLFALLAGDWPFGTQAAIDVAMVGRFYERFADHSVSVGRQVAYLVTGSVATGRF
ncbi:MAG TPA: PhoU domain-containing protein [Catenuloplanes sp.]|jgi:phosphate transport system protein